MVEEKHSTLTMDLRNIDFQFKIAAQSKEEMFPLYTKLNYLVSNTTPEYSDVGRMRTPFIKLTVGDWCNSTRCFKFNRLTWQKDYPWIKGKMMEKVSGLINIAPCIRCKYSNLPPIHNFMPEKSPNLNSQFFNLTGACLVD